MLRSIYLGALAEVNQIRQNVLNLPPLDKFPSCVSASERAVGVSYCYYCPVAQALQEGTNIKVLVTHTTYEIDWLRRPFNNSFITQFINIFDLEYQTPLRTILDPWDLVTLE